MEAAGVDDYFKDVGGSVREDRQSRKEAIKGLA